jgi:hypothetical protein
MTELIVVEKIAEWQRLKALVPRQRLLADYAPGVQHCAGRIQRLLLPAAAARLHQGDCQMPGECYWEHREIGIVSVFPIARRPICSCKKVER